jgi:superfamily I DNA/RNA helicase
MKFQDHRCVDIVLLLKLVKNPRGIHLAGDTAQCISKDSTFRFADVKALFYEQFFSLASATNERTLAFPAMFKLNRNFRSHQGIISLASFVMNLLYTGFPQTVDKMDEERGQYSGPIPTLFVGLGTSTLAARIVGIDDAFRNVSDFGAEQVIIVRDDAMKKKVQDQIGDIALVLTILDSKGMEFDDVFLLDFFTSTPCASSIRALETILTPGGSRAEVEGDGASVLRTQAPLCRRN